MSKRNAALEAIGRGATPQVVPLPTAPTQAAVPAPAAVTPAAEKSDEQARVMLYTHPKVARKFKEIAFIENRKANDVYLAALDLYLTQQGHGGLKGVTER